MFTAWSSCRCVFPALLHFSAFSFYGWALETLGVVFILRSSLWGCCNTWSSWSAVLITNPWACLLLNLHQQKVSVTLLDSYLSCSCALFTVCIPFGSSSFPAGFSARSSSCHPLLVMFSASLCLSHSNARSAWCDAGLVCETHSVLLWYKKVLDFYREISVLLFSLCFLPGKKGLKFGTDPGRTPAWRSKAEFCSLCFPILFSGLLCSRLPFPWIWLPSGHLLHNADGIASVSVPSMTLQQTPSLSKWDPVCCSPVPPDCLQGCYLEP